MTMADMDAACDYLAAHPPVHILVAAYMGVKPPTPKDTDGMAGEMVQAIPGALEMHHHG